MTAHPTRLHERRAKAIDALFSPKHIAVVGASQDPAKVGHAVFANLIRGGYAGRVSAVNPYVRKVLNRPTHATLRDVSPPIDLVVIAIPTDIVGQIVGEAIAVGVKAIAIVSSGFGELSAEGREEEARIAKRCRQAGVGMLGPNCLGVVNAAIHMNASFAPHMPPTGGVSVVSQSGALCAAMLDDARARGIGLAKMISVGNMADLTESELIDALAHDDETRVIACYLEAISDGDAFIKAAEAAASVKPVVVLKAGVTAAGARAAVAHTGSVAGEDMAYGAAFKRAGVIRAESYEALLDYAMALGMQPLPKGPRVAIITNGGGPGIIAADALESVGLEIPEPGPATAKALADFLPAAARVGNPIDLLGDAAPDQYARALKTALADPGIDAAIVALTPQAMTRPLDTADAILEVIDGDKPVLATFIGGTDVAKARNRMVAAGLPAYDAPERAAAAMRALHAYAAWRRRPPRVVTRFPVNRHRVERILARHRRARLPRVGEAAAKEMLRAYAFHVLPGQIARGVDEAVATAERIGYPVAMKIVSPDIVHKNDVGGVRLALSNADQVRDAFDLMWMRVGRALPEARLEGVYVEQMAKPGREVILGMRRDPQFGPMLMFGLGGIFVEMMEDVSFHLAPITEDEAMRMLSGTRSYAMMTGARGDLGVDLHAIAGALQRVSQLATDFPHIHEMDINPLIVGAPGAAPVVADARMILAEEEP